MEKAIPTLRDTQSQTSLHILLKISGFNYSVHVWHKVKVKSIRKPVKWLHKIYSSLVTVNDFYNSLDEI